MNDQITQHIEDGILHLVINRPDKRNALTHAMYSTLSNALNDANEERDIRVIYLTGSSTQFTSGNDIGDFASNPPSGPDSPVLQFLRSLAKLEKPLVVAANGPAVGIGTTLMLHSDFVILGENTKLQMPFVSLGLCPEAASSYLLPKRVGYAKTSEWLLLGKRFDAKEALESGLANEVLPEDKFQARALEIANELTALPAASVAATRRLIKQHEEDKILDVIETECKLFLERIHSPEAKEAFMAFFQKRAPNFKQFE